MAMYERVIELLGDRQGHVVRCGAHSCRRAPKEGSEFVHAYARYRPDSASCGVRMASRSGDGPTTKGNDEMHLEFRVTAKYTDENGGEPSGAARRAMGQRFADIVARSWREGSFTGDCTDPETGMDIYCDNVRVEAEDGAAPRHLLTCGRIKVEADAGAADE